MTCRERPRPSHNRSRRSCFPAPSCRIQFSAVLIEVSELQPGAHHDFPTGRCYLTQDQFEKGALSTAVGTNDPDPVAAQNSRRQTPNNKVVAVTEAHVAQVHHQLTGHAHRDRDQSGPDPVIRAVGSLPPHNLKGSSLALRCASVAP